VKILNLYAGIGGNRKLWGDEHEITAVELKPDIAEVYRALYPDDRVIVSDAHQYLLEHYMEYDFIWTSPPCPTHSRARYGLGFHGKGFDAVYPDMKLYEEIILLKHHFKGKWVVENVQAYYEPLIEPRSIGRHWYWSNFHIDRIKAGYTGISNGVTKAGKVLHAKNVNELQDQIGIDLTTFNVGNKRLLLRNCVEPEVGLHILNQSILTDHRRVSSLPIFEAIQNAS
jgi:DNA (cytosine-5)-methyltransferase 1